MTAPAQSITPEQRRELEDAYRQAISLVRSLARLLDHPCPIATRAERRNPVRDEIDGRGTGGLLDMESVRHIARSEALKNGGGCNNEHR